MSNIEEITKVVKKAGVARVLVQIPAGLKTKADEIAAAIEKNGTEVIISASPMYGACDLADKEAKQAGCDLLVHIGHSKFYVNFETEVPVIYYPWEHDVKLENVDFSAINEKRIGLVTTIQHMKLLKDVSDILKKSDKEAVIGGQILGCWFANATKIEDRVDAFLFVGSGRFHPLGIKTDKPLYSLDIERNGIQKIDAMLFEKKRFANIYNARNAASFAILVSTKEGQRNLLGAAEEIKKQLQQKDKKAFIVIMDEINDANLQGIKADAYINTACPRLADDTFSKPFMNAGDIDILLEE